MNRTFFKNTELDSILDQMMNAKEDKVIVEQSKKASVLVFEHMPYVPLWYQNILAVHQKEVSGFDLWPNTSFRGLLNCTKK